MLLRALHRRPRSRRHQALKGLLPRRKLPLGDALSYAFNAGNREYPEAQLPAVCSACCCNVNPNDERNAGSRSTENSAPRAYPNQGYPDGPTLSRDPNREQEDAREAEENENLSNASNRLGGQDLRVCVTTSQ